MEPERKIEKLLRAYAKKRKADADGAFKLHPATRRMLQGEVARRTGRTGAGGSPSFWNWLHVRWVVPAGFAFAILLCIGMAVFFPASAKKEKTIKMAAATPTMESPKAAARSIAGVNNAILLPAPLTPPAAIAAPATSSPSRTEAKVAVANSPASSVENRTQSGTMLAAADGLRAREMAATNAASSLVAAVSGAVGESVTVAKSPAIVPPPAAGEPTQVTGTADRRVTAKQIAPGQASDAPVFQAAAAAPAGTAKFKSELAMDSPQNNFAKNSQKFMQAPMKKENPQVLASFELRQNGNLISVVDGDGSIYNGTLQPVPTGGELSKAQPAEKQAAPPQQKNLVAANSQSAAQNYAFQVSGANRSLKQNVVFSGNFLPISNVTANAAQNFSGGFGGGGGGFGGAAQQKLANAAVAQQQPFFNSRIEGTVTIDQTNQIEINAMPVNP